MQYLLMLHSDEKAMQAGTQDQSAAMLAAYGAYTKAMSDAGVRLASQRLRPTSTATTVRVKNGKTQVLNGPYAEVKEQLGGYLSHRRARSRRRDFLGGALPRRRARRDRSAGRSGRCDRRAARTDESHEMRDRNQRGVLPRISGRRSQPGAACGRVGDDCRALVSRLPGWLLRPAGEAAGAEAAGAMVRPRRPALASLTARRAQPNFGRA